MKSRIFEFLVLFAGIGMVCLIGWGLLTSSPTPACASGDYCPPATSTLKPPPPPATDTQKPPPPPATDTQQPPENTPTETPYNPPPPTRFYWTPTPRVSKTPTATPVTCGCPCNCPFRLFHTPLYGDVYVRVSEIVTVTYFGDTAEMRLTNGIQINTNDPEDIVFLHNLPLVP